MAVVALWGQTHGWSTMSLNSMPLKTRLERRPIHMKCVKGQCLPNGLEWIFGEEVSAQKSSSLLDHSAK
ncbi:hypothetical protein TNCV_165641 [Trichonephila clavipes]|nr:hypothetical protein TNCV_165641 [Trichonephila clavipes]